MKTQNLKLKTQKYNSKLKSIKTFAFLLAILTFNFCLFTLNAGVVNADGVGLKISPTLLQIKAQAPASINQPLIIENMQDNSITLSVQLKLFKSGDKNNGQIEFLNSLPAGRQEKPDFGNNKVQIFDNKTEINELTLGPKQKKNLNLKISIPKAVLGQRPISLGQKPPANKQTPSEYYFSIVFITKSESITLDNSSSPRSETGQNSYTTINTGIASNVLLSIKEKSDNEALQAPLSGDIEEFTAPSYTQSGPILFNILIKNTSPEFISPIGIILIKNMFGQNVGRIEIPAVNILSGSSRYIKDTKWTEKFLLGLYNAELSIKLSDQSPILTKNLSFFAFPTKILINLGIIIVIILIIYSRIKNKL